MAIKYSWNFALRKLHQLTGVVPLGLFFFVHMFTNSKAMNGEESFEKAVADIHGIPFLLLLEIFGIFIPLLFHSIYGVIISTEARPNVGPYPYARNWFYVIQRATGIFLFVFLTFHILNLRFGLIPGLNLTPVAGNADLAFGLDMVRLQILVASGEPLPEMPSAMEGHAVEARLYAEDPGRGFLPQTGTIAVCRWPESGSPAS